MAESVRRLFRDQQFPAGEKTLGNKGLRLGTFVKLAAEQMFRFGPFSGRIGGESRT